MLYSSYLINCKNHNEGQNSLGKYKWTKLIQEVENQHRPNSIEEMENVVKILHLKKVPGLDITANTFVYSQNRTIECNMNYSIEKDGMLSNLFYKTTSPFAEMPIKIKKN